MAPLWVRIIPAALVAIGLGSGLGGAFTAVSPRKGRLRLSSSLFIGVALIFGGLAQIADEGKIHPGIVGPIMGGLMAWWSWRSFERDPLGTRRFW